mgnify:CR=1 FL=1
MRAYKYIQTDPYQQIIVHDFRGGTTALPPPWTFVTVCQRSVWTRGRWKKSNLVPDLGWLRPTEVACEVQEAALAHKESSRMVGTYIRTVYLKERQMVSEPWTACRSAFDIPFNTGPACSTRLPGEVGTDTNPSSVNAGSRCWQGPGMF